MALSGYLIDTSVIHRRIHAPVRDAIEQLGVDRPLYRCAITELEVLRSATSPSDYEARRSAVITGYVDLPITPQVMRDALAIQRQLAAKSHHRAVSMPDMIIAACAQAYDAVVVHYDADYDHVAEITGQPVEWVVPAGAVD